jgi:DNA-binding NarL/FixJ family response regulator
MRKTVALVEDDRGLREQLLEVLGTDAEIQCLGVFGSAEDGLKEIPRMKPDVVLMDIQLPGMSGIECVAELRRIMPSVNIIMVTVYEDNGRIFKALKAGANGYIVKSRLSADLLQAIRDVFKGGAPMSIHIARKVVNYFHATGPSPTAEKNLSDREDQVLTLLASGFIYKEIGEQLNISVETVRSHVKNICEKMHVRSRIEAVAKRHVDTKKCQ